MTDASGTRHVQPARFKPGVLRVGTRASALYVCAYYAGSSLFGWAVGFAWTAASWGAVVGSVTALVAVGLVAGLGVPLLLRYSVRGR